MSFPLAWLVLVSTLVNVHDVHLYELNDDAGRKAFLDELFDFMQKRELEIKGHSQQIDNRTDGKTRTRARRKEKSQQQQSNNIMCRVLFLCIESNQSSVSSLSVCGNRLINGILWLVHSLFHLCHQFTTIQIDEVELVLAHIHGTGTPITRLPIMAKQVLDLYELYNLVVARGGLVDVINKKLWQEIIKGLHLPSSITSAAFTLRTQYMKYLYPYECEKEKYSSPNELQAAIDGNRREGRRSSYGAYADLVPRGNGNGGGGGSNGGGGGGGSVSGAVPTRGLAQRSRFAYVAHVAPQSRLASVSPQRKRTPPPTRNSYSMSCVDNVFTMMTDELMGLNC
uniref:ARID domain-containing protein n=1 Tax=Daphnia galeata TaxID=27404 RepID=A0A8J2RJQ6_9CRUS|nr:unnamed protein product [Daphnia galeata]